MHLRKYSRQYLIDVMLFFAFVVTILTQEYFHYSNPFVSAFDVIFIIVYPAKFILGLLDLKMKSVSILGLICAASGIAIIDFFGMSISLVGGVLGMALLTRVNVLLVMSAVILILMVISKDLRIPSTKVDMPHYVILSALLVVMSILGSVIMNQYKENIVSVAFWFLVLITAMILVLKKDLTLQTKMVMVFAIALSSLLNYVVISDFITGYDIFYEYSVANMTISQGYWNIDFGSNVNAMLSIGVFAPVLSWVGNIDVLWIFKLVYPFLFAIVPVGVYLLASKMANDNAGVIAALLFILIQGFLFEMPSLARQEIGELFLISLLIVAMFVDFTEFQKAALGIMFGFGLITSHYGTTLLFLGILAIYYVVRVLFKAKDKPLFSGWHVLTLIVIELTWLLYVGAKGVLGSLHQIGNSVYTSVVEELSFTSSVVADRVGSATSLVHSIGKYAYILMVVIVALGVLAKVYHKRKGIDSYSALCVGFGLLMVISLTASNFLVLFSDIRMVSLVLIVVGSTFYFGLTWIMGLPGLRRFKNRTMHVAAVFIAVYLLFNTGLVYALTNDGPTSIALSTDVVYPNFTDAELKQAMWTQSSLISGQMISADRIGRIVCGGFGWFNIDRDNHMFNPVDPGELMYLGHNNLEQMKFYDTKGLEHPISVDSLWANPVVYSSEYSRTLYINTK
ncbi:MAG TPA: DUF2206 domain-containing protein [Methanomassiliicoccales archaeon]|jgi:uncharacterized membrane protein